MVAVVVAVAVLVGCLCILMMVSPPLAFLSGERKAWVIRPCTLRKHCLLVTSPSLILTRFRGRTKVLTNGSFDLDLRNRRVFRVDLRITLWIIICLKTRDLQGVNGILCQKIRVPQWVNGTHFLKTKDLPVDQDTLRLKIRDLQEGNATLLLDFNLDEEVKDVLRGALFLQPNTGVIQVNLLHPKIPG